MTRDETSELIRTDEWTCADCGADFPAEGLPLVRVSGRVLGYGGCCAGLEYSAVRCPRCGGCQEIDEAAE